MDYKKLNKYQTPLNEELINVLPKDLYADIIEYIDTVAIINWLIQPEEVRGTIADRPFMEKRGKVDPRGRHN